MILLMGIAGSGKGTQGKMLADQHGYHLISMGDVVRMYVTGEQRQRMLSGKLLDDDEIIKIVEKVLSSMPTMSKSCSTVFRAPFPRPSGCWSRSKPADLTSDGLSPGGLARSRQSAPVGPCPRSTTTRRRSKSASTNTNVPRRLSSSWLAENGVRVVDINAERPVEAVNADIVNYLKQT